MIRKHFLNIVLFCIMMIDYILTYIGLDKGVIAEGNKFMVWLFNLDFKEGFIIRIILTTVIVGICVYIKEVEHKWYKYLIGTGLMSNLFIFILHFNWIIREGLR